jgi:hypothetical protein
MPASHSFYFNFLGQACEVELLTDRVEAARPLHRYLELFPAFAGSSQTPPELVVRIHDVSGLTPSLPDTDAIFPAMRKYFSAGYAIQDAALQDRICSPAFVPDEIARQRVREVLDDRNNQGLSLQKDFLVCSDRGTGRIDAFADVSASLNEAWAFHVLNFFKIFFFAAGAVRLHGSGATAGDRALLFLANTGGGKSTMKNFFLGETTDAEPFTDDSILALRSAGGFRLYQDPVEFMRWAYLPEDQLSAHVIPQPRPAIEIAPAIYYLERSEDPTAWERCAADEVFQRVNSEAFFQQGYLTQRFIPQPRSEAYLQDYLKNTRDLLAGCACHLARVRHHDDYRALFEQWRADLGLPGAD